MKFAITGIDIYHCVLRDLLEAGWEPVKLFTWATGGIHDHNKAMLGHADQLKIPAQASRMTEKDLDDLAERGCDIIISAGYNWKIPPWEKHVKYAVNFHCSPLPEGRGAWPLPQAIWTKQRIWGSTLHKIAPEFDVGDILAQETFALEPFETHSSLNLRCQMSHRKLTTRLVTEGVEKLWQKAKPQKGGSYWKRFTDAHRTFNWNETVDQNLLKMRAFDTLECIAILEDDTTYFVRKIVGWREKHDFEVGQIVHFHGFETVVSVKDGYIALLQKSPIPLEYSEIYGR